MWFQAILPSNAIHAGTGGSNLGISDQMGHNEFAQEMQEICHYLQQQVRPV
jgi:hypothetical protein